MKEIQHKDAAATEQVSQTLERKTPRQKARYNLKPGQKTWQINLITGEITEAKVKTTYFDLNTKGLGKPGDGVTTLVEEPNCIYIPAINKRNARKKFDAIVMRATGKKR
jgi:hypothetical protein